MAFNPNVTSDSEGNIIFADPFGNVRLSISPTGDVTASPAPAPVAPTLTPADSPGGVPAADWLYAYQLKDSVTGEYTSLGATQALSFLAESAVTIDIGALPDWATAWSPWRSDNSGITWLQLSTDETGTSVIDTNPAASPTGYVAPPPDQTLQHPAPIQQTTWQATNVAEQGAITEGNFAEAIPSVTVGGAPTPPWAHFGPSGGAFVDAGVYLICAFIEVEVHGPGRYTAYIYDDQGQLAVTEHFAGPATGVDAEPRTVMATWFYATGPVHIQAALGNDTVSDTFIGHGVILTITRLGAS